MAKFATEFPVSSEMDQEKFCTLIKEWLIKNPNSKFTEGILINKPFLMNKSDKWCLGKEELSYTSVSREEFLGISIQYIKHEKNITFVTDLTFTDKEGDKWVSCEITNSTRKANTNLPDVNKPKIINKIISNNLGGESGLKVIDKPYFLEDDNINLVANLINGNSNCRLPVVYISALGDKDYLLTDSEIASLSQELAGIAHVVVEPNREFSFKLSDLTDNLNVFKGYVGIYWANGSGRNIIFSNQLASSLYKDIVRTVVDAVSNRRLLDFCNRNFVKNEFSTYQDSRNKEDNELLEISMKEESDLKGANKKLLEENEFLKEELRKAENEIDRLKDSMKSSNKNISYLNQGGGVILNCMEKDLYPGEIKDMLLIMLSESKDSNTELDRRKHILESILENNPIQGKGGELRRKIKDVLSGYTNLDAKSKKSLESIGFKIEEGAHYKCNFQGDSRYSMVLTRSGSDSKRGGKNAATDICKKLGLK